MNMRMSPAMLQSFINYHLNAWTDAPDYAAPAGYRFETSRGKYCLLECGPNEIRPDFYWMQGGRVGCPTDPQGRGTIHKIVVQGEAARNEHLARGYVEVKP